ncbi:MAG: MBL fold metallo-hydrolase, partial [Muribaculaceae bacterium]|nr:MBL fold metallo-hydrolase [Muribaculaceae bacterium]
TPDALRFMSFGSGSSGNCSYIGTPSCGLLIDAGVDNNFVTERLAANSIDINTIQGILLTHDHGDHVRFAYAILRRNRHMRLYATPKAFGGLLRRHSMSRRIKDYHSPIYKEFPVRIGQLTVTAFETSHDGTDNAGFHIEGAGTSFVVATDTGTVTARADHYIRQARHLMIESNYDAAMLRNGRYPQYLKARILSTSGHLDNADTARYLASVAPATDLSHIFLCHLSQDNNTPQIAFATVRDALEQAGVAIAQPGCCADEVASGSRRVCLSVLPRTDCSPLTILK